MSTSSNQEKHESRNPVVRWLVHNFHRQVVEAAQKVQPRSILDLGCGEGYTLSALHAAGVGAELSGIDLSARAVDVARKRLGPAAKVSEGDARDAAAQGDRYDLVLMLEVLEHLADPVGVLSTLGQLSRAHVLLSVPWEPFFRAGNLVRGQHLRRLGNHPEHVNLWSRRAFHELVGRHFEVVSSPAAFPWTLVLARVRSLDSQG